MGSLPTAGDGLSGTQSFWLPRDPHLHLDLALNSGQHQASHSTGLGCPGRNGPQDATPRQRPPPA